ncbi:hypothetical protein PWT90_03344 [Aphanocladium album]|nr:hypothetical protein PWT90_03344 [Aphanocladium album]
MVSATTLLATVGSAARHGPEQENQGRRARQSSVTIGNPSFCIFYQHTGREWTIGQTVQRVQNLLDHGCKACGSVPVDPGNNVKNGELTANYVTNAKRADVWTAPAPIKDVDDGPVKRADVWTKPPPIKDVVNGPSKGADVWTKPPPITDVDNGPGKRTDVWTKPPPIKDEETYPGPRRAVLAQMLASRALGINCRASSTCQVGGIGHSPAGTLQRVRDAVAASA